jgi:hypothetical protein
MKHLVVAAWASTSTTAVGLLMVMTFVEAGAVVASQQGLGPESEITGLTLGMIVTGFMAGSGFLVLGVKQILKLGEYIGSLKATLSNAERTTQAMADVGERLMMGDQQFKRVVERMDALELRVASNERFIHGFRSQGGVL